MRISGLSVFAFPVPFKVVFRHASASRGRAENLIVAVHGDNGDVGYGEGCPRHYVTGETVPGGLAFIRAHADSFVAEVHDLDSLRAWMLAHRDAIDRNPAAFCAMEIATLDLFGRACRKSVEALLGLPPLHGSFRYSAVLGDAPHPAYRWQLHRYRRRGFSDFKVKLSGHPARDRRKMQALAGTASSIRLDANNLWTSADDCIGDLAGLPGQPFAIEEPLGVGDLDGFRTVGEALAMRVILDESLLRAEQLESLPDPERWIVNLRVSKMGGILRSIDVAKRAASLGIDMIVGCQVGETSILTRAALPVMRSLGTNLVAAEGAFGTWLLQRDLTSPSLTFGDAGRLAVGDVSDNPGLGLGVCCEELTPLEHA
ncbi:MAG: hypothetical protein OXH52_15525 [Gammaproteobacteria bacterium]|nr:hypothetical protein [Gammaproteobacteria bacterium]